MENRIKGFKKIFKVLLWVSKRNDRVGNGHKEKVEKKGKHNKWNWMKKSRKGLSLILAQ